jgi:hypothetical protein
MRQSRHSDRGWRKTMVLARPKISPRRATRPSNTLSATKSAKNCLTHCNKNPAFSQPDHPAVGHRLGDLDVILFSHIAVGVIP